MFFYDIVPLYHDFCENGIDTVFFQTSNKNVFLCYRCGFMFYFRYLFLKLNHFNMKRSIKKKTFSLFQHFVILHDVSI